MLADRGFNVADGVAMQRATLNIPPFMITKGCDQLPPEDVEATRKLGNARIHVERVVGSLRQRFQILSATGVVAKDLVTMKSEKSENGSAVLDLVVKVCCALNNTCEVIP